MSRPVFGIEAAIKHGMTPHTAHKPRRQAYRPAPVSVPFWQAWADVEAPASRRTRVLRALLVLALFAVASVDNVRL